MDTFGWFQGVHNTQVPLYINTGIIIDTYTGWFRGVSGVPRNPFYLKILINCPQTFLNQCMVKTCSYHQR